MPMKVKRKKPSLDAVMERHFNSGNNKPWLIKLQVANKSVAADVEKKMREFVDGSLIGWSINGLRKAIVDYVRIAIDDPSYDIKRTSFVDTIRNLREKTNG